MRYEPPLEPAILLRRYKRFLADVELPDGTERTVHCANPGAMTGLLAPRARCWLWDSRNPKRRLRHSLELVEADGTWVCVNTARTNPLVADALDHGALSEAAGATAVRREVRCGESRLDFLLTVDGRPLWLEVKQATLASPPLARFPDAQTERGRRHLRELSERVRVGERAALLFVATRADVTAFSPADDVDPDYGRGLRDAHALGVEVWARRCRVGPEGLAIEAALRVEL